MKDMLMPKMPSKGPEISCTEKEAHTGDKIMRQEVACRALSPLAFQMQPSKPLGECHERKVEGEGPDPNTIQ